MNIDVFVVIIEFSKIVVRNKEYNFTITYFTITRAQVYLLIS